MNIIFLFIMLSVKSGKAVPRETYCLSFPYDLDEFQLHAINAIDDDKNVLVTAHTGSGKTSVAEYAIQHGIKKGGKVIYTSPIKALSMQLYSNFRKKYPRWDIGIKTGDISVKEKNSQVVIMTTEILRNMIFGNSLDGVNTVIFDEVHWIKDKNRGTVWEECIIMLPEEIQMVMLSATLPDAESFGSWVAKCKGRDVVYSTTDKRVVPLSHYIMRPNKSFLPLKLPGDPFRRENYTKCLSDRHDERQLDDYLKKIQLPALFFCFSRYKCRKYAGMVNATLHDSKTSSKISNLFDKLMRNFSSDYRVLKETREVKRMLVKGVGYHHAGLPPALKEVVQELFSMGLIKVLFVTETFAAGVNMPAKSVVFTGLTKPIESGGYRFVNTEEYTQMAGRAGRRGLDTTGNVIILPLGTSKVPRCDQMEKIMCGEVGKIESSFRLDPRFFLNCIINGMDSYGFYSRAYQCFYNEDDIEDIYAFLLDEECLYYDGDDLAITDLGRATAKCYQCNPIGLIGYLAFISEEEQEFAEIASCLSVLINSREQDRVVDIPTKNISEGISVLCECCENSGIYYETETYQNYCDIVYNWINESTVPDIVDTGEFINHILKLNNICKTALEICEMLGYAKLVDILKNHQEMLIKSIVVPESLYLDEK